MVKYSAPLLIQKEPTIASLQSAHAIKNLQMTLAADLLSEKIGISARCVLNSADHSKPNNARYYLKVFKMKVEESFDVGPLATITYAQNKRTNAAYNNIYPETEALPLARINRFWGNFICNINYGSTHDVTPLPLKNYVGRTLDAGTGNYDKVDIIEEMGVKVWLEEKKEKGTIQKEKYIRDFSCSGSFFTEALDYSIFKMVQKNGSNPYHFCVPFDSPTSGRALDRYGIRHYTPPVLSNLLDLNYPALPVTVDPSEAFQKMYLSVRNGRKLFLGNNYLFKVMYTTDNYSEALYDDSKDDTVEKDDLFSSLSSFRF
jgi:hypothetical protein